MNYIDLFAGIGGFALGAKWAGWKWEKHYFSEIDDYAIKVYQKHFPEAIQLGDIIKIDTNKLPKGDYIITGGFPCQDISIAGKMEGLSGKRSGLWFEMWRIIRDIRPRFAIIENVGMFTRLGLSTVLGNLAEIGYNAEWQDIRAEDVGAPHKRERIWIVAYPSVMGLAAGASFRGKISEEIRGAESDIRNNAQGENANTGLLRQAECEKQTAGIKQLYEEMADTESRKPRKQAEWERRESVSRGSEEISNSDKQGLSQFSSRQFRSIQKKNESSQRSEFSRRNTEEKSWNWWSVESDVGRVAHGIPSRVDRLRCLGNSIVPQIAEILFRRIKVVL